MITGSNSRPCAYCGKEVTSSRALTCSASCRQRLYVARKRFALWLQGDREGVPAAWIEGVPVRLARELARHLWSLCLKQSDWAVRHDMDTPERKVAHAALRLFITGRELADCARTPREMNRGWLLILEGAYLWRGIAHVDTPEGQLARLVLDEGAAIARAYPAVPT